MPRHLNVLMISHHRRLKAGARPHAMAKHLVQRGHTVTLIVTADDRRVGVVEAEWEGVRTIETPDLLWGRLRSGWDLWDLLHRIVYLSRDKGPYDLVHCFETRPATIYPALFYCRRHKLPLVSDWNDWWGRGGIIREFRPKWYRAFLGSLETHYEEAFRARGAGLTVISTALARRAEGLGVPPERICYLPGGTFPDFFQARTREECRNRVGLPLSAPILGFSSLDGHWDLEIVMQALAIVAEKCPTVKLIITGKAGGSVLDLARAHGVEANVHLTGFLPMEELPWYLGCADLFLLPFPDMIYNVGRWPNKIGDYLSIGRPTVSNPVGDVKVLFESQEVGLLAGDAADFAQKIVFLIENPDVANRLGENARQVAVTTYDWRILIRRLEEFYYGVLDQQAQSGLSES
ncbi:MAG: glycosyltransferase family 4 protein [Anaerolineae bacterium]|nr:glycosyltransferase family 4 protein [Anaerolineae bacterium]